jgi:hypothetical protein
MVKEIYIKRFLRHTKEGQGFYCSKVFIINGGLSKPVLEPLLRMGENVYILERQEVAIPTGKYAIAKDFTGRFQWATLLNVPNKEYIEIHKGNYLESTDGCLLFGVCYDENKEYSNEDSIIKYTEDTCDWFINDFLLNDEQNKQTKKVKQDEVIGHITIA